MLNPAEPNTTREIKLTYVTDEEGSMEISIDSLGFEDDPRLVPLFLAATIEAIAGDK